MADPLVVYRELLRVTREQLEHADAGDWDSLDANEQARVNALAALPYPAPAAAQPLLEELVGLTDALTAQITREHAVTRAELGRARANHQRATAYGQRPAVTLTDVSA